MTFPEQEFIKYRKLYFLYLSQNYAHFSNNPTTDVLTVEYKIFISQYSLNKVTGLSEL